MAWFARLLSCIGFLVVLSLNACGQGSSELDGGMDGGSELSDKPQWVLGTVLSDDLTPIEGATVTLDDEQVSSDSNGRFGFATRAGLVSRAVVVRADGFLPMDRQVLPGGAVRVELGAVVLRRASGTVHVQADQEAYLDDTASGMEIELEPGTFPEDVDLTTARIPLGDPLRDDILLPSPLPVPEGGFISGLFAIQIDAGGLQPSKPLQVAVRVELTLPPGTKVPYARFDTYTGKWMDQGTASVGDDGKLVFQVMHLSTFAAALPALPADDRAKAPDLSILSRAQSTFKSGDPRIDPVSGALQVGMSLPPLIRGGKTRSISLFHDSRTVEPKLVVPVAAADASMGEILNTHVSTPVGKMQLGLDVQVEAKDGKAPAVVVDMKPKPLPKSMQEQLTESSESPAEIKSGSSLVDIVMERSTPGVLMESQNGLFSHPVMGLPIVSSGQEAIKTANPVRLGTHLQLPLAVDKRTDSPFGLGWHLSGLTRLVQPFCSDEQATVVGEVKKPAISYGKLGELISKPMADRFVTLGKKREQVLDTQVAVVGGTLYVSIGSEGEVYRIGSDGNPVLVAGGGFSTDPPGQGMGTDLNLGEIKAIATGPNGKGLLIVTSSYISIMGEDGSVTRVVGTGASTGADDVRTGQPALESSFDEDLGPTIAADPTSDRFVFSKISDGAFEVSDGVLKRLRLRVSSPHWHHFAFDPNGQLLYSSDSGECIYKHVDGLTDPEIFPLCRGELGAVLKDGPADEALVGGARAMAFDPNGNLWFFDGHFGVLRKYDTQGSVVSLSAQPKAGVSARPTVSGLLQESVLGFMEALAILDARHLWMGGSLPDDLIEISPASQGTLIGLSAGDGSVLRHNPDGNWLRVLADGQQETYDQRGLLLTRGPAGETPMEYVYDGDWEKPQEDEVCGLPMAPPKLKQIEFAGEVLWSFEYRDEKLVAIIDAASRRLDKVTSQGMDRFDLPGDVSVEFRYDDEGRVIDQRKPGPDNQLETWLFAYQNGRLSSYRRPDQVETVLEPAQATVAVSSSDTDASGVLERVDAKVPTAMLANRAGKIAKVVQGTESLQITSPAGDETDLESDAFGRLIRVRNADGSMLHIGRDEAGRVISFCNETIAECYSYSFGKVVVGQGDDPYVGQRLIHRVDPAGRNTWFDYDSDGTLLSRRDPNGSLVQFESVTEGAAMGLPHAIIDAEGRRTEIEYDRFGNTVRILRKGSDGGQTDVLETRIERDAAGFVLGVTEPSGRKIYTELDQWGQVVRRVKGDVSYGNVLEIQRTPSASWCYKNCPVGLNPVLSVTDGLDRTWSVQYAHGWLQTNLHSPVAGDERREYDSQALLSRRLWDDGSLETVEYDEAGRVARRLFAGPAQGAGIEFEYEELGRASSLVSPILKEDRSFGPGLGWAQVQVSTQGSTPAEAAFSLKRDRPGFGVTELTLGTSRFILHLGFDDNVQRIEHAWTDQAQSRHDLLKVERDSSGRLTKIVRANGTESRLFYDPLGRPVRLEEQDQIGTKVFEWTWRADHPIGRTLDGVMERALSWDAQGRLTGCSDTGETFTWNQSDERISASGLTYERDGQGRILFDGAYDYSYDALGRRVSRVSRSDPQDRTIYQWGAGNRLHSIRKGEQGADEELVSFEYDGSSRLVSINDFSGTTWLGYIPDSDRIVRILTPDSTEWHLVYAFTAAAYSAAVADDGRARYLHLDPFDKVLGVSDENGVLTLLDEDCFGVRLSESGIGGIDFGFHGMLYHAASGLYLSGARVYDPRVGEFLSPDPKGLEAAPSAYGYAGGDPIMAQDPGGQLFFVAMGAALVGAYVFNEIRKFTQSDDVKKTRRNYERMGDVADDDSALEESEHAHENLSKSARKGGQTALKATKKAYDSISSPAEDVKDLADGAKDLAESVMEDSTEATNDSDGNVQ